MMIHRETIADRRPWYRQGDHARRRPLGAHYGTARPPTKPRGASAELDRHGRRQLQQLLQRDVVEQSRTEVFLQVVGRSGAKGDRYRMVPLSPALAKRIRRYVDRSRPTDQGVGKVVDG
jgi:hypothetical protein